MVIKRQKQVNIVDLLNFQYLCVFSILHKIRQNAMDIFILFVFIIYCLWPES